MHPKIKKILFPVIPAFSVIPAKAGICILLFIMLLTTNAFTLASNHSRLNQLNHKIASIKASLSNEQDKRSQYSNELKKTEVASGQILLKLKNTQSHLHHQQQLLNHLNRNAVTDQSKLNNQREWLAEQIRAAYLMGKQPTLKLVLNPSHAERIGRILTYYRYISHDQMLAIHALQATLVKLQNNQEQIRAQTNVLIQLQKKQQQERGKLEHIKHNRNTVIQQISTNIQTKNQKLDQLLTNKQLLEHTIDRLEKEQSVQALMTGHFDKQKGKLPWPAKGKILPYFGTKIDQSELKWTGILIKAAEDQPVHAIAAGKIVFAKWLPGYGLLLIISHGHGYMTLYGRTHYLYKKAGDTVNQGDLIATVGDSGGYGQPALYFAIRHNAKPLNPVNWCHGKT